jgi:hypothetical protein
MVMDLLWVVHRPDPQYSADSFRKAMCTRLEYGIRLSRLHTLDPPLALAFSRAAIQQHGTPGRKITK